MTIYSFSLLCFAFGTLLIAVLVFLRRGNKMAFRFLIFSLFVTGWGFPHSLWTSQHYSYETSLALARTAHAFANFIPITWFHFAMEFIERKRPFKYFYAFNYLLAALLTLSSPFPIFIKGMHPILDLKYYTTPGLLFHFYTLSFLILVPVGFYYLVKSYLTATGYLKEQLKYLLLATFIGFSCGSAMFPPTYNIPFPLTFLLGMPLFPVLMGVALMKYGLFDVKFAADMFRRDKLAAMGTLAASINHEIRNPLYVIQGLAQAHLTNMDEGIYPSQQAIVERSSEILKKTADQATRAMEIMKRFAVFVKQGVKESPEVSQVSLSQTLEEILPLIRHELELDKIDFVREIPSDLSAIKVDPRHLEEIFFNLIVNACQAIKNPPLSEGEGGVRGKIQISASQHNGTINVTVADNGPGIPPNRLNQIFEPFYTTKEEGTGLGLYVTKQLIERNGGKISVKSKLGDGTTFFLDFKK